MALVKWLLQVVALAATFVATFVATEWTVEALKHLITVIA